MKCTLIPFCWWRINYRICFDFATDQKSGFMTRQICLILGYFRLPTLKFTTETTQFHFVCQLTDQDAKFHFSLFIFVVTFSFFFFAVKNLNIRCVNCFVVVVATNAHPHFCCVSFNCWIWRLPIKWFSPHFHPVTLSGRTICCCFESSLIWFLFLSCRVKLPGFKKKK